MVKWKKISKRLAMFLMAVLVMVGSQTTAFAYTDQSAEATETKTEAETKDDAVLEEEHTDDNKSFSVPGNAEVLDDIEGDSSKEFLTVTTKNNNTFYIVIDRSSTTDNVYMLSQIDENDLKDFLEEESETETKTPGIVLDEEKVGDETPDVVLDDAADSTKDNVEPNVGLLSMLALAGAGVGAYYFFKIRKAKQDDDDSPDEGLETGGMEEDMETVNEDEEATQNN